LCDAVRQNKKEKDNERATIDKGITETNKFFEETKLLDVEQLNISKDELEYKLLCINHTLSYGEDVGIRDELSILHKHIGALYDKEKEDKKK
jgi:hypothetical protein